MEPIKQKQIQTLEFGNVNSAPIWVTLQIVRMAKRAVEIFSLIPATTESGDKRNPTHKDFVDVETIFRLIDEWLPGVFQLVMSQGEDEDNATGNKHFPILGSSGPIEESPAHLIYYARDAGVVLEVCQEFLAQLDRIGMVDAVKDMV